MLTFGDPEGLNFGSGRSSSDRSLSRNNASTTRNSNRTDADIFLNEWLAFKLFWDWALAIYQPIEVAIIAVGLLGNILAFLTLLRSRKMSSNPSFIYHRVLVAADLLFCMTYFLHLIMKTTLSVSCHNTFYRYRFGAYFSGTLNPAMNYVCGYLIMYMTLVIALDRFLALLLIDRYRTWNTMKVAYCVTLVSCLLSICLHCWPYFTQNIVIEYRLNDETDESTSIISKPCWTEPVVYYWTKQENVSDTFKNALKAKDYYNGAVRVGYPVCLCILTLGVLIGFAKRRKKRRAGDTINFEASSVGGLSTTINGGIPISVTTNPRTSLPNPVSQRKVSTLTVRSDRSGSVLSSFSLAISSFGSFISQHRHTERSQSPSLRHRQRCERALFYLMIAVVLLAFLQVASSESRRILHLIFPPDQVFKRKVLPNYLPMVERVRDFRFLLYGHQATRIIANLCTAIDRSFICFLYIAMNNLFRKELLAMLKSALCFWRKRHSSTNCSLYGENQHQDNRRHSRNALLVDMRLSPSASPLQSPSPTSINFPSTLPFATDRGYANCRYLGENLVLLDN